MLTKEIVNIIFYFLRNMQTTSRYVFQYLDKLPENCYKIDSWDGRKLYGVYFNEGKLITACRGDRFKLVKQQEKTPGKPYVFVNAYDGKRVSMAPSRLEALQKTTKEMGPPISADELNKEAITERNALQELKRTGLADRIKETTVNETDE
jgi:hypothetical protein